MPACIVLLLGFAMRELEEPADAAPETLAQRRLDEAPFSRAFG